MIVGDLGSVVLVSSCLSTLCGNSGHRRVYVEALAKPGDPVVIIVVIVVVVVVVVVVIVVIVVVSTLAYMYVGF